MIILQNATILHLEPAEIIKEKNIIIQNGKIEKIQDTDQPLPHDAVKMNLSGKVVMPGLVCSHHHFYSALARGIMAPIPPSHDFVEILRNLWWRLDRALDRDSLFYSAQAAAMDALQCGVTTVYDHHASPSFISGSLSTIADAMQQVGLRGVLCYEITDRNGREGAEAGLAETEDFYRQLQAGEFSQMAVAVGGHAPFTLSDQTLSEMGKLVQKLQTGSHIHVSEDAYDAAFCHHQHGLQPLERLDKFGLLNEKSLVIHGVNLNDVEMEILNRRQCTLVQNPRSNMNNAVGYARQIGKAKFPALGTDGIGGNLWEEIKFAFFKNQETGAQLSWDFFPKMLQNGQRLNNLYFPGKKFGRIEAGYEADLVVLDYDPPTPLQAENLVGHLIFGMSANLVRSVMVGGKWVYLNRQFSVKSDLIMAVARREARRLWQRMAEIKP